MIIASQPTNPKSIISSRIPNISLKTGASFSKKACPKKILFIMKYTIEAAVPIIGEEMKLKFK
jgi:hypothetical protein